MKRGRVADNKTFINRISHLMDKVVILHHRHLVDESLVEHILIGFLRRCDLLVLIGKHLHAVRLDHVVERRHDRRVKRLVIDDPTRAAVGNAPAVESEDVAAIGLEVELIGQRRDAISGAAGSQHDGHAFLLCLKQSRACVRRHLFLTVCQRAVKVEHDH